MKLRLIDGTFVGRVVSIEICGSPHATDPKEGDTEGDASYTELIYGYITFDVAFPDKITLDETWMPPDCQLWIGNNLAIEKLWLVEKGWGIEIKDIRKGHKFAFHGYTRLHTPKND